MSTGTAVRAAHVDHAMRSSELARRLREAPRPVRLGKETSSLFRGRAGDSGARLDAGELHHVLDVDPAAGIVEAEGLVTYESLVDACLARGVMPAVVAQLKTITLGGAVAGVGIEAASHRYGLAHETVTEIEVLTGAGRVVACTRDNEFSDLFFGFPNSHGTLGYALRVKARTAPVKPFVHIEHLAFSDAEHYFEAVARHCARDDVDFIDGTLFAPDRLRLTLGRFTDTAPYTSDYTYGKIYYRSIESRNEDWLTARDFLWRWDTDWLWGSKNLLAQNPVVRRALGRRRLGSRTYARIMRWDSRVGLSRAIDRMRGMNAEAVIQDVDVPIGRAPQFLAFLAREIGIWPVWMCPIRPQPGAERFALYPMKRHWYVNFGFRDVVRTRDAREAGRLNRLVERAVAEVGGIKSLYSESFFPPEEFGRIYGGEAYRALKAKYDPAGAFPTLYDKCVRR